LSIESHVRLFQEALSFGPVHIIVVNHAIYVAEDIPLADMSLDQWKLTMNANLTSSFLVIREFLRGLKAAPESVKNSASLVFVGSSAGKFGEAQHADYAASKSAIMYGFLRSLKNEIVKIAPKARVNCIAPGWTRTPLAEESLKDPNVIYRALATTPLRKVAVTSDIASQIAIISSQRVSGHISGEVLMVTGGMEAGRLLNLPEDLLGSKSS